MEKPHHDFDSIFSRLSSGRPSSTVEVDATELATLRHDSRLLVIAREIVEGLSGISLDEHLSMLNAHAADVVARGDRRRARKWPRPQ